MDTIVGTLFPQEISQLASTTINSSLAGMAADRRNRKDDEHDVNFGYGSIHYKVYRIIR